MACPPVFVSQAHLVEQSAVNREVGVRIPGGTLHMLVMLVWKSTCPVSRNESVRIRPPAPGSRLGRVCALAFGTV